MLHPKLHLDRQERYVWSTPNTSTGPLRRIASSDRATLRGRLFESPPACFHTNASSSSSEPGNEIQSPLTVVVLGGLLTSLALNMVVVPVQYARWGVEGRMVR